MSYDYGIILLYDTLHTPISSNFPNNLIKSDFLILQSFCTAASETQPFAFRDTTQLFLGLFAVLGGIDTVQQLGKRNRGKVHHMQPVEKLMLLIFNLRPSSIS